MAAMRMSMSAANSVLSVVTVPSSAMTSAGMLAGYEMPGIGHVGRDRRNCNGPAPRYASPYARSSSNGPRSSATGNNLSGLNAIVGDRVAGKGFAADGRRCTHHRRPRFRCTFRRCFGTQSNRESGGGVNSNCRWWRPAVAVAPGSLVGHGAGAHRRFSRRRDIVFRCRQAQAGVDIRRLCDSIASKPRCVLHQCAPIGPVH